MAGHYSGADNRRQLQPLLVQLFWTLERPEFKQRMLVRQAEGVGTYDESVIADDEQALNVNPCPG